MEIRQITFSELRTAYETVYTFLKNRCFDEPFSLKFKIEEDGFIYGDDIFELLEEFVTQYEIDFSAFEFQKHFSPEGGCNPFAVLIYFFSKKEIPEIIDLTLGDLITSFLEKKFTYRHQIKYILT